MGGYVMLFPCFEATAAVTRDALLVWFKTFGVVTTWVSDQGSHFKNEVIELLRKALNAVHHFVFAHCHWANGTVEVVNKRALGVFRPLLSELKLPIAE